VRRTASGEEKNSWPWRPTVVQLLSSYYEHTDHAIQMCGRTDAKLRALRTTIMSHQHHDSYVDRANALRVAGLSPGGQTPIL
jgi:hypothetical protein